MTVLSASGPLVDEAGDAIKSLLATHKLDVTVEHQVMSNPIGDGNVQSFSIEGASLLISSIGFGDPSLEGRPCHPDASGGTSRQTVFRASRSTSSSLNKFARAISKKVFSVLNSARRKSGLAARLPKNYLTNPFTFLWKPLRLSISRPFSGPAIHSFQ